MRHPSTYSKYVLLLFILLYTSSLIGQSTKQEDRRAPDFQMTLEDGSHQYISFWALWCSPCLTNFNKYRAIRQQLSDMDIVLLNVSIDHNLDSWKKALEDYDIKGVHAHVPKSDLYPGYEISSIPLYDIIGKNGAFRYLSDEAGRDILAQFEAFKKEPDQP